MNAIATQADNLNPFETYGQAVSQRTIIGDILKFSKGEWLAGKDDEEVEEGTEFVALMDEMMVGWVKWEGGKPSEHIMGRVIDGYKPPRRSDLGDNDKADWEADDRGDPRDPWQFTNYLILKAADSDKLFTFATSSRGGINALGALCKDFGKAMRAKPNDFPIVAIGSDSYRHPNKAYGKIHTPSFTITGWTPKAPVMAILAGAETPEEGEEAEVMATPPKGAKKTAAAETHF